MLDVLALSNSSMVECRRGAALPETPVRSGQILLIFGLNIVRTDERSESNRRPNEESV